MDHWRTINSPGYLLHAVAHSLRRDLRDASKNDLMGFEDALDAARASFPSRNGFLKRRAPDQSTRTFVPSRGKFLSTEEVIKSFKLITFILHRRQNSRRLHGRRNYGPQEYYTRGARQTRIRTQPQVLVAALWTSSASITDLFICVRMRAHGFTIWFSSQPEMVILC